MDKFSKSEIKGMFEGPLTPVIFKLSMPILAGMVFQFLYNIVDTAFINFIDPTNPAILGATGVIFPIIFIAMALGNGLTVGMSALVAKGIGAKDEKVIYKTAESGLFIALTITIFMLVGCYAFGAQIITILGAKDDYYKYAIDYFYYILPALGFMFFANVLGGILQGEGLMKKFMTAMIIGTVLNIILDPIFIFKLELGVKGAALATVIAQFISFLYILSIFIRKQTLIQLEFKKEHISPQIMKNIIKIGFPQSFGQLIMSGAFIFMNRIAFYIDPLVVTSSSLVGRIEQIVYMPVFAIAAAVITIVGQNKGRGTLDRVEKTWYVGMGISTIILGVTATSLFIFSPWIYGLFKQTEMVTFYATTQTRYIMPFIIFVMPVVVITRSVYQAIGYPIPGLIITSLRFFIIVIPAMLVYVFVFDLGFYGMLYGHITAMIVSSITAFVWMKSSMKKFIGGTLKTLG